MKTVYWAGIEYKYNVVENVVGGFVYAFVRAVDEIEAMRKIILELEEQGLTIIEREFVRVYDENVEWEKKSDAKEYLKLYRESLSSDEVIFDTFYTYEEI